MFDRSAAARTLNKPKLYPTPIGWSSSRPTVEMPPIDRRAVMLAAHAIARKSRQFFVSYREALAYGLHAAWQQVGVARRAQMLTAQVERQPLTTAQIAASRVATRRCGASFIGA